ncbi:hypothetical protein L1987_65130 [Smallanthus sonchifolius]|uniref:Uncharacterized protein n=1 Tax=Smallanthus sonchifolius TaxID=185202 RepID=A0ACB9BTI7_9ASTR|nr:hypothetical protein L1987_65130 [Smallanthus sonchifolius]
MLTSFISPFVDEEHLICIVSSFQVAKLGESPEHHPLLSEGSETEPSDESVTSPSPDGYGGLSQNPLTRRCHHFPEPWARVFGRYSVKNRLTTNLRMHCSMHTQTLS